MSCGYWKIPSRGPRERRDVADLLVAEHGFASALATERSRLRGDVPGFGIRFARYERRSSTSHRADDGDRATA